MRKLMLGFLFCSSFNALALTKGELDKKILSCTNKNMDVATGKGVLRLHEVQLPGGKRMSSQAFLNAHDIDGVKLG